MNECERDNLDPGKVIIVDGLISHFKCAFSYIHGLTKPQKEVLPEILNDLCNVIIHYVCPMINTRPWSIGSYK